MRTRSPIGWPKSGEKDYNNQCNNKQHLMQHAHKGEKSKKAADDIDWRKVWGIFAVIPDCVLAVRNDLASFLRFDLLLQNTQDTASDMSENKTSCGNILNANTWITFSCVLKLCLFLNLPWWWTVHCPYLGLGILSWRSLSAFHSFFLSFSAHFVYSKHSANRICCKKKLIPNFVTWRSTASFQSFQQ